MEGDDGGVIQEMVKGEMMGRSDGRDDGRDDRRGDDRAMEAMVGSVRPTFPIALILTLSHHPLKYPLLLIPPFPLRNPPYHPSITFSHDLLHHPLPSHSSSIITFHHIPPPSPLRSLSLQSPPHPHPMHSIYPVPTPFLRTIMSFFQRKLY